MKYNITKDFEEEYAGSIKLLKFLAINEYWNEVYKLETKWVLTPKKYSKEIDVLILNDMQQKLMQEFKALEKRGISSTEFLSFYIEPFIEESGNDESWSVLTLLSLLKTDDKLKDYQEVDRSILVENLDISSQYNERLCSLGVECVAGLLGIEYLKPIAKIPAYISLCVDIKEKVETGKAIGSRFDKMSDKYEDLFQSIECIFRRSPPSDSGDPHPLTVQVVLTKLPFFS